MSTFRRFHLFLKSESVKSILVTHCASLTQEGGFRKCSGTFVSLLVTAGLALHSPPPPPALFTVLPMQLGLEAVSWCSVLTPYICQPVTCISDQEALPPGFVG